MHLRLDEHGKVVQEPDRTVYVVDESELAAFVGKVPPGAYAISWGGAKAWQLKPDGTWVEV